MDPLQGALPDDSYPSAKAGEAGRQWALGQGKPQYTMRCLAEQQRGEQARKRE